MTNAVQFISEVDMKKHMLIGCVYNFYARLKVAALLFLLALVFPLAARGQAPGITFDSETHTQFSGLSVALTHTVSGTNTLLLAQLVVQSTYTASQGVATVSYVFYGGNLLTRIFQNSNKNGQNENTDSEVWYLVNPPSGSMGVSAGFSGGTNVNGEVGLLSYDGVNQSSPIGATSYNNASAAITLTTTIANSYILGMEADQSTGGAFGPISGQTQRWVVGHSTDGFQAEGDDKEPGSVGQHILNYDVSGSRMLIELGLVEIIPN
jgi:hypothetical protein